MDADKAQEGSNDLVFKKEFVDVPEGTYQYKIRLGEDHWVLDESTESVPDEHGNLNNVVHVKSPAAPLTVVPSDTSEADTGASTPDHKAPPPPLDDRNNSFIDVNDSPQLPSIPIPFVVVEKVEDKEHLPYGDLEPVALSSDTSKRAADAEPDFEEVKVDSPVEPSTSETPPIPLLVVEKTDDNPAHGDDFGEKATSAQKLAHEQRAADASPDRLVISPERSALSSPGDEEVVPLFSYEIQTDEPSRAPSSDTIDEVSVHSSTDQTSSSDIMNTPSDPDEVQDDGQPGNGTLLIQEIDFAKPSGELRATPLFLHEEGHDQEETDEFDRAPLLSHETGLDDDDDHSLSDADELDKAPLLSHETGFSDYKRSEIVTKSEYEEDDEVNMEPQHYGPYDEEDGVPLLPHERDSAISKSDSEDDEHSTLNNQPTFGYETDAPQRLFGGNVRPNFFRTRTNSSTLPHKLPRTDEDDDNLDDPSLEQFPTSRDQILERVKTIGLHLPEDEATDNPAHSPQFSVLSQACSSVELGPVKSYTSLASVPEVEYSDEDEEDDDVESLASPIMIGGSSTRPFDDATRDDLKTPAADESKQLQLPEAYEEVSPSLRTTISSEAESVDKHDGVKDTTGITDAHTLPIHTTKGPNTATPSNPLDSSSISTAAHPASASQDSTLRNRRKDPETNTSCAQGSIHPDANTEHTGPITRFITACAGDRKKASVSMAVVFGAVAAAWWVGFAA